MLVKEKAPLLGKSFHTGLHYFPVISNLTLYNEHHKGINYAVFSEKQWWMVNDFGSHFIKSSAFEVLELNTFGLFT